MSGSSEDDGCANPLCASDRLGHAIIAVTVTAAVTQRVGLNRAVLIVDLLHHRDHNFSDLTWVTQTCRIR